MFIRRVREDAIPRPGLMARLDEVSNNALTLISAPAGFGKTTLLAQWLTQRANAACWLSLDAADNDTARFLAYLVAAMQRVVPELGEDLRAPLPPSPEVVITTLINEVASLPRHIILVLDDYHVIASAEVNAALCYLLENLPPNLHLIISTRSDPPIPLARLRLHQKVLEIRASDLRFSPKEAADFFTRTMGLALSVTQVAVLEERTEGWVAGLQMAALSMRGRADLNGFIEAFAGTNRFVLDFLVEEVLSREPPEIQAFMLQTATLARLSGPLCDAVTGDCGGQEKLEQLERRNVFVVPLDDERRWYRYHHLFADLLRARLQQTTPDLVPQLYARASQWCEHEGLVADSVTYSLMAHDFDRAALLAEGAFLIMSANGDPSLWPLLHELPEASVRRRPLLCAFRALVFVITGRPDQADEYAQTAEELVREDLALPNARELVSYIAAMRAYIAEMQGRDNRAVQAIRAALDEMGEQWSTVRSALSYWLGESLLLSGDFAAAEKVLSELVRDAMETGMANSVCPALGQLLRMRIERGCLTQAVGLYDDWVRFAGPRGRTRYYLSGNPDLALAKVLLHRNLLGDAVARLMEGIESNRMWANPAAAIGGYCRLARALSGQRDREGAEDSLTEAKQIAYDRWVSPDVRSEVTACQVYFALARNDLAAAETAAAEGGLSLDLPCDFRHEADRLTLTRLLIARGECEQALAVLAQQERSAREGGRTGRLIEILALRASAIESSGTGERETAMEALAEALGLAEPEGYVRIFIDEGEPIARLLRICRQGSRPSPRSGAMYSLSYVDQLLTAFVPSFPVVSSAPIASRVEGTSKERISAGALVEPLTKRETEVVRLMAEGCTNEQIAAKLFIAVGTVKAHIHNVSGKLGARNRAHTVARAKEVGIL